MTSDYADVNIAPHPTASERRNEDNPSATFVERDGKLMAQLRTGSSGDIPEVKSTPEVKTRFAAAYEAYRKAGGTL